MGVVPAVELFKAATNAGYIIKAAAMFTFCNPNTGIPLINPEDPKKEYKVRGEATAIDVFCGDRELQELYAAKFNVALPSVDTIEEEEVVNENEHVGDI